MKLTIPLKYQLAVLLIMPFAFLWTGFRYLSEAETLLQQQATQRLSSLTELSARQLATLEVTRDTLKSTQQNILFKPVIFRSQPQLDGYEDDWRIQEDTLLDSSASNGIYSRAAAFNQDFYLYLYVPTNQVRYLQSGAANTHDHITLRLARNQALKIEPYAPGNFTLRLPQQSGMTSIEGVWQEVEHGFSVELKLPQALAANGFSLQVTTSQSTDVSYIPADKRLYLPTLVPSSLSEYLSSLQQDRNNVLLITPEGRQLLHLQSTQIQYSRGRHIVEQLADWVLADLEPTPSRPSENPLADVTRQQSTFGKVIRYQGNTVIVASAPITLSGQTVGYLVIMESLADWFSLQNAVVLNFLALFGAGFVITLVISLFSAGRIYQRITQLKRETLALTDAQGALVGRVTESRIDDEINDLARSINIMGTRLQAYTDYLEKLAARLQHELKTPIAIVRSSLENQQQCDMPAEAANYNERAREGLDRLNRILRAMNEARDLESSMQSTEFVDVELVSLLKQYTEAVSGTLHGCRLTFNTLLKSATLHAAPELLAQALDKLIANATDFHLPNTDIRLYLTGEGQSVTIRIQNQGPSVPSDVIDTLFEPLVSLRERKSDEPHLGLGLYIVKLVANVHGGSANAVNKVDPPGVQFSLTLPAKSVTTI